jgi:hypothetical protein
MSHSPSSVVATADIGTGVRRVAVLPGAEDEPQPTNDAAAGASARTSLCALAHRNGTFRTRDTRLEVRTRL